MSSPNIIYSSFNPFLTNVRLSSVEATTFIPTILDQADPNPIPDQAKDGSPKSRDI